MNDDDYTESEEFPAPFVRVRGRVSRSGQVHWSPCLRTEKGREVEGLPSVQPKPMNAHTHTEVTALAVKGGEVFVAFSLTHLGEKEESKKRRSSQQGETKKLTLEDDLLWMHPRHYGTVGESKSSS
jgi:hypothetical protein